MAGSVTIKTTKKKSSSNFFSDYDELCRQRKSMPIRNVKANAWKKTIDFYADRIKCHEWIPIIEAISKDRSLHCIAIRSRYKNIGDLEDYDTQEKTTKAAGRPAIQTKFVMDLLMKAIYRCLLGSVLLTCLVLEGLSFTEEYLTLLCDGISNCKNLQIISFDRCCLGDDGCELVCNIVKHLPNIRSLGFSGCNLSDKGGLCLCYLLKHQQLERYNESWKQSLRHRELNSTQQGGVRRITLNDNKDLGDAGILPLIEILKDDYWVKAIDIQNCGITNTGASNILKMLELNNVLLVVDIRNNRFISSFLEADIMRMLARNNMQNMHEAQEYPWFSTSTPIGKSSSFHSTTKSSTSLATITLKG